MSKYKFQISDIYVNEFQQGNLMQMYLIHLLNEGYFEELVLASSFER